MKTRILLLLTVATAPALAQTAQPLPRDTTIARQLDSLAVSLRGPIALPTVPAFPDAAAVKQRTDTVRYLMRSSTSCSVAACRSRVSRLQFEIDSLVARPPSAPVNQQPVARFTVSWSGTTATLDASSSTDDKGIVAYQWTAPPRPLKTGAVITRSFSAADSAFTETLTVTDAEGLTATATHQLFPPAAPPPPPVDTTTPPPTGSSVPALPRSVPVVPTGLDQLPCTVNVPAGGLQAALNAIGSGSVLCLTSQHTGSFTYSACPSSFAVLRTAGAIPAGRMRPSLATGLAKIVSPGTGATSALIVKARSCRLLVLGIEITASLASGPTALVEVGEGTETALSDLPTDIVFDRVYIHGGSTQKVRRAFVLNGRAQTVTNSWCAEIHDGFDSQCIISWNGAGPILLENNTLEAASENIMLGGADSRIPGVVPSDVTIRRNHIVKPIAWKGAGWNVKVLIESKAGARVLIEDNVLDGSWLDGQTGYAFVLKSTNQQGGCHWCSSYDWTIRRNLIRNVGAGFTFGGRADGTVTDSSNRRMLVEDNWIEPVNVAPFAGDGRGIMFTRDNTDITIRRNVFEAGGTVSAVLIDGSGNAVRNLNITGNVFARGTYGLFTGGSSEGLPSWTLGVLGTKVWAANAMLGPTGPTYPAGTTWHATLSSALLQAALTRSTIDAAIQGVVIQP